ncbi:hypothetical protein Q0F99_02590 [Rathayibacter oskolensis]|uniref:hypothetical protein n=1 Tax=Rathayibacter oskolensis TaxID=1891671 RepID=UPI00265D634E|nr:hypothetical protein [Rathayibacter oskolensis]WKK72008.1 hypothetical protein Q0F99_02590 [Rathayibacter oskolensis]
MPGRAPRGVEVDGVEAVEVEGLGVGVHRASGGERGEVEAREGGGDLVGVDGRDLEVDRREGEGVAADTAAEVGDARGARRREPAGVECGDTEARRLLEARVGEEHRASELAELRRRALAGGPG